MNENSPENLRKFLESDEPAMVRMGLSMAKGSGASEELLPTILSLYMWNDDKTIRAAAKSVFTKYAPLDVKDKIKQVWKPQYRNKLFVDKWEKVPFIHHFDSNYHNLWIKKTQANWVKLTDDFQKIILFYETFQSQEELACIILDPLIYFLGYEEFKNFEYNPVTHVWMDDGNHIFEHPIIISAIKTLISYGLVKSSRSSHLHRKEILPKYKKKVVRKNVAFILGWADNRLEVKKNWMNNVDFFPLNTLK